MSWLISLLLAGAMFTSDGSSPLRLNNTEANDNIKKIEKVDEIERFEQTYPLNSTGRVSISNVNGSITIDTWDSPQVKLEYVKTADSRERLSEAEVRIDARQDSIRIETEYGNQRHTNNRQWRNSGNLTVAYRLTVPRTAVLDEIETVNGSINISNAANMTKASAVNGEVRATNLRGAANLSTVNGSIQADFDRLQTGSRISLNTVNGTVNLTIPSDANATVKADTVNGSITNDFGLRVRKGQYVGKDLYGKIGTGDVQIKLNSVNGGLAVKRKNDGKGTKPVQDLLPQKNKNDDFDNDNDNDNDNNNNNNKALIDTEQINREVARAVAESKKIVVSEREIAKAVKEAEKEISRLNTNKIKVEALQKVNEALRPVNVVNYSAGMPVIEKKSNSFAVKGIPKVTIETKGCAVSVRGWDKPEVQYSVVKVAENRKKTALDINAVNHNSSNINIKVFNVENSANRGSFFDNSNRVRVEIFVPKNSNLKVISDGEIRLEGVTGEIDLQGDDQAVNVRDVDGKLSVRTADGRIRVIGFRGAFVGKTADGAMNLEGDFETLSARTIDGAIVLTLPENADAIIESNRKDITSEGFSMRYLSDGQSTSTWQIGTGGRKHLLYATADGKIVVRSAGTMKTN